jgi:RHS repeat-associated protein
MISVHAEKTDHGNASGPPAPTCWATGYVYMNGALLAEYESSTTHFVHGDHLSSTRLVTDLYQNVAQNLDYLPFGELNSSDSGITSHEFTGDEHDPETTASDLHHTLFRQYSPAIARWMTPDPAGLASVNPAYPQSWNRYAYVLNNPLALTDPLGLDCIYGSYQPGASGEYEADSGVFVVPGDCLSDSDNGLYVDNVPGTVIYAQLDSSGNLSYTFASLGPNGDPLFIQNSVGGFASWDFSDPNPLFGSGNSSAPNNPNCSGSNAQVVANASIAALSHLNPTQDETNNITPRDGNFANVVNPALINTNTWTNAASAHGSSLQSPTIPGQNIFVVKLYNDPNRGNIIAVVYPNGTLAHMQGLIPFLAGSTSVNVPAARAYLGCPAH